jgi:hypothetical protein
VAGTGSNTTGKEIVLPIFRALGLDLDAHLAGPQQRPFPLVDFGTQAIKELLA